MHEEQRTEPRIAYQRPEIEKRVEIAALMVKPVS